MCKTKSFIFVLQITDIFKNDAICIFFSRINNFTFYLKTRHLFLTVGERSSIIDILLAILPSSRVSWASTIFFLFIFFRSFAHSLRWYTIRDNRETTVFKSSDVPGYLSLRLTSVCLRGIRSILRCDEMRKGSENTKQ